MPQVTAVADHAIDAAKVLTVDVERSGASAVRAIYGYVMEDNVIAALYLYAVLVVASGVGRTSTTTAGYVEVVGAALNFNAVVTLAIGCHVKA